jgi:predicted sulfurtransferase
MDDDKNDGPKVVTLDVRNQMKADVEKFQRALPELIQHARTMAKVRRASYLTLIEEGFTESQALELCKTP